MAAAKEKKKSALISYFEDSYQEIRKVSWPTKNQAVRLTFLVLGFVFVVSVVIGILDFVFGSGYRALLDVAPDQALPQTTQQAQPVDVTTSGNGDDVPVIDVGELSSGAVTIGDGEAAPVEVEATPVEETSGDEISAESPAETESAPSEESSS